MINVIAVFKQVLETNHKNPTLKDFDIISESYRNITFKKQIAQSKSYDLASTCMKKSLLLALLWDRLQILFLILNIFKPINFYFPWNNQKTWWFQEEEKLINSLKLTLH